LWLQPLSQCPQCSGSERRSTHSEPQSVMPHGQPSETQAPPPPSGAPAPPAPPAGAPPPPADPPVAALAAPTPAAGRRSRVASAVQAAAPAKTAQPAVVRRARNDD